MLRLTKNQRAASNFIGAVVMLIAVMMAAIIGAVVFFAFSSGTDNQLTETWTGSTGGAVDLFIPLGSRSADDPQFNLTMVNGTTTSYIEEGATGYEYIEANNTIRVDAVPLQADTTSISILYFDQSHDVTESVILYAITVFALLAIIPLVMVGGLMLRSLGFMGGGESF